MAQDAAQARLQVGRTDILCVGLDGNHEAKGAVKRGDLIATLEAGPVAVGKNAIEALVKALWRDHGE